MTMLHECRLTGTLLINPDLSDQEIESTLDNFFNEHDLVFDFEILQGGIGIGDGELYFELQYDALEAVDSSVLDLVEKLSAITTGPNLLIVVDNCAENAEDAAIPLFIGTPEDRKLARARYGIALMAKWIGPIIGADATTKAEQEIMTIFNSMQN